MRFVHSLRTAAARTHPGLVARQPAGQEAHDGQHLVAVLGHGIVGLGPLDVLDGGKAGPGVGDGRARQLARGAAAEQEDRGPGLGHAVRGLGDAARNGSRQARAYGHHAGKLDVGPRGGHGQRGHGALAEPPQQHVARAVAAPGHQAVGDDVLPDDSRGRLEAGVQVKCVGRGRDEYVVAPVERRPVGAGEERRQRRRPAEGEDDGCGQVEGAAERGERRLGVPQAVQQQQHRGRPRVGRRRRRRQDNVDGQGAREVAAPRAPWWHTWL